MGSLANRIQGAAMRLVKKRAITLDLAKTDNGHVAILLSLNANWAELTVAEAEHLAEELDKILMEIKNEASADLLRQ